MNLKISITSCGLALAAVCFGDGIVTPETVKLRKEGAIQTVRGEKAVVHDKENDKLSYFAHAILNVANINPDDKIEFTLRATIPDGASSGALTVALFDKPEKKFKKRTNLISNRVPSKTAYEDIVFTASVKDLGLKGKQYMLLIGKKAKTQAVAFSKLTWKIVPAASAPAAVSASPQGSPAAPAAAEEKSQSQSAPAESEPVEKEKSQPQGASAGSAT